MHPFQAKVYAETLGGLPRLPRYPMTLRRAAPEGGIINHQRDKDEVALNRWEEMVILICVRQSAVARNFPSAAHVLHLQQGPQTLRFVD